MTEQSSQFVRDLLAHATLSTTAMDGILLGREPVDEPLNVRVETAMFKKDPLFKLLDVIYQPEDSIFVREVTRYSQAYHFYALSVEDVLKDISIGRRWNDRVKYARGGKRRFSPQQRAIAAAYSARRAHFELHFTNVVLHARIVLDRSIAFSRRFLTGRSTPSYVSFNDHKRFFTKHPIAQGEPHHEYAEYLVNRTDWFDLPLKVVRDKFVVHASALHSSFLGYPSNNDLEMILIVPEDGRPSFARCRWVHLSVRRLARDIETFLTWYGDYALNQLSQGSTDIRLRI